MRRRSLLFLPFVLLLAACGSPDAGEGGPRGMRGDAPIPAVEVIQARLGALPLEQRLSGRVRAENQVVIYPEISAPVMEVLAQDGDRVRAGQPLVRLRDTQYREQLRQAQAQLQINQAEAKRTEAQLRSLQAQLRRTEELAAKQYQSEQSLEMLRAEVDAAEATREQALGRIELAEASIEEAQEALRRTVVRAPITGFVGQRAVDPGQRVDPSSQLFTIGNLEKVRVEIAVPDEATSRIQTGQTALIRAEGLGDRVVRAEISRISPFLQAGSYSAAAEIDVDNADGMLRPGMFVTVDVQYGESQQATILPVSTLYEHPATGVLGAYVATSLGAEVPVEVPETYDEQEPPPLSEPTPMAFREVTVLARGHQLVGVEGIQPGEWVVTVGQNLLSTSVEDRPPARVRAVPWTRVAAQQELQDRDLLREFMEKQQRLAREEADRVVGPAAGATARNAAAAP